MRKIGRLMAYLFVVSLFVSSSVINLTSGSELHENQTPYITVYESDGSESHYLLSADEELIYNIPAFSNKGESPTSAIWLLSAWGPYHYSITNMTNQVYTNRSFYCDSQGCLSISTDGLYSGGSQIKITLGEYIGAGGAFLSKGTWIGDPQSIQGLGWGNLDSTKLYFFRFQAYEATSVSGDGYIHHPGQVIP